MAQDTDVKDKVQKRGDSWDVDSGLPDDWDFEVERAEFIYDEDYNNGETCLLAWYGQDDNGEETRILWPCGSGWEVINRGQATQHPKREHFVATSIMGRLIKRLIFEIGWNPGKNQQSTDAKTYQGLKVHLNRETIEFGQGLAPRERLMPTALVGGKKGAAASKSASASRNGAEKEALPDPETEEEEDSGDALRMQLTKLAIKTNDIDAFQTAAMKIKGVKDDKKLMGEVLEDGDDGFWAKARAD